MKAISYLRTVSRTRRRRLDRPRLLTYTVTFGCNARCVMCDSWRKPTDDDLRLWEIERILRQLPRLDAVRLTGGEPFVRQDLVEIARLVDRHLRPMVLHVTTNGFLTRRIVDFCERRPTRTPLHLLVSIDGVGRKHDEIRGNATAYRSAMRTIEDLAPRRKELRISLAVNQTIVDATGLEHYRLLREALRPFGVRNHVVMAYDRSATYAVDREVDLAPDEPGGFTTFGVFTRGQLAELLDEVERDLPGLPVFERLAKRYYLRGIRNRLLGGRGAPNPPCVAPNAHLRIFPDGTVPTCHFNTKPIGNLREQPFDAVWNGVLARTQREWVAACPGCWAECEALPSAVYTGDLLGEVWRGDRRAVGESARAS